MYSFIIDRICKITCFWRDEDEDKDEDEEEDEDEDEEEIKDEGEENMMKILIMIKRK